MQPVEIKGFRPVHTWTRDVSSKGLFLEMDQPLQQGTRILLTLHLPAEITGRPVLMRCVSRVVRVANRPNTPRAAQNPSSPDLDRALLP